MCVLCTSTSDRTLAGNGSTSLRATLLTSVRALVHTSAVQTPLTARYILSGLVALIPPVSPSDQHLVSSKQQKQFGSILVKNWPRKLQKSLGGSTGKMCFLWNQY